jgi:hypothetical protein
MTKQRITKRSLVVGGEALSLALALARKRRLQMLAGEQVDAFASDKLLHELQLKRRRLVDPHKHKPRSRQTGQTGFHKDMDRFFEACVTGRDAW